MIFPGTDLGYFGEGPGGIFINHVDLYIPPPRGIRFPPPLNVMLWGEILTNEKLCSQSPTTQIGTIADPGQTNTRHDKL